MSLSCAAVFYGISTIWDGKILLSCHVLWVDAIALTHCEELCVSFQSVASVVCCLSVVSGSNYGDDSVL